MAAIASPVSDPAAEQAALLYEQHHGAIMGYCVWRLRRREDAEEAAQTTFARALGALRRGQYPRNERAWLVTIARNVCTTLGTAPHRAREIAGDVPDVVSRETDHGLDPDLELALAALPEGQRRALLLREWQDLSYREIAAELGVSVGTVETWIFRARRSLASALEHTRRGFSLAGLLRWLTPSGGAKVAGAVILATAAVATEQAVVPHGASDTVGPATPAPIAIDPVSTTVVATPRPHAATRRAARTAAARGRSTAPILVGGNRVERDASPVGGPVSQAVEPTPKHEPAPAATAAEEQAPAPALPTVQTPGLPLPAPTLPPVETPTLPALPVVPPEALPSLPSATDLPLDPPKLP